MVLICYRNVMRRKVDQPQPVSREVVPSVVYCSQLSVTSDIDVLGKRLVFAFIVLI